MKLKIILHLATLCALSLCGKLEDEDEETAQLVKNIANEEKNEHLNLTSSVQTEITDSNQTLPGIVYGTTEAPSVTTSNSVQTESQTQPVNRPTLDLTPTKFLQTVNQTQPVNKPKETLNLTPSHFVNKTRSTCVLQNGEKGVCVEYYQCLNTTVITDGESIFDVREKACGFLKVCCKYPNISQDATQLEASTHESKFEEHNGKRTQAGASPNVTEALKSTSECGWSNRKEFIFKPDYKPDRKYANYGEFPWMVAILRKHNQTTTETSNKFISGGAIIHKSVVITTAHNIFLITEQIKCRGGEYDQQTTFEKYPFQERDVSKTVIHPTFKLITAHNDVALLFLEQPFDLNPSVAAHMGVGCLGQTMPKDGTTCFGMGWGKEQKTNQYAIVLKKIKLALVNRETCETQLRSSRLGSKYNLHHSLTCAGGEESTDTCKGDGGSPLVCPIEGTNGDRHAIYGLVAYGVDCFMKLPGVYVNIPDVYDWVNQAMTENNFEKPYIV